MPYRDKSTVDGWVADWLRHRDTDRADIAVLDDRSVPRANSAVVVVMLRSASTITHLRPVLRDERPCWVATFEPRDDLIELDHSGLRTLAEDMALLGDLLDTLQSRTDAAVA